MWQQLAKSTALLVFLVIIVCGIYPFALWVVGQVIFPFQANGSIINGPDGKPVGSLLIAQAFTKDEYFQPRPSAASYDATASASSALAASNPALRARIAKALTPILQSQSKMGIAAKDVPADMVTTSASGLDPHITLDNALFQLDRVAGKWAGNLNRDKNDVRNEIEQLLQQKATAPLMGLAGEKIINVLEINLELRKRYGAVS